jgi:hypothetical protein
MTPEGIQRRTLLRGLFAGGCLLYLPQLAGCKDRQASDSAANPDPAPQPPAAAAPPGVAAQPDGGQATEAAGGKMAQSAAQYQSQPKGDQDCAGCLHFVAQDNSCKVVAGQISPQGWCILWAGKAT